MATVKRISDSYSILGTTGNTTVLIGSDIDYPANISIYGNLTVTGNLSAVLPPATITYSSIVDGLGYVPYDTTNPNNFITSSTANVVSVNGHTGVVNLSTSDIISSLGYTPVNKSGDTGVGTINNITFTQPSSNATLTIANGKVLTVSNVITLSAVDGSTLNIGSGGTLGNSAYTNTTAFAPISHVGSGGTEHATAVANVSAGFISAADQAKLNGIAAGATNFSLPNNTGHSGEYLQADGTWSGVTQRLIITLVSNNGTFTVDDTGEYIIDIQGSLTANGNITANVSNPNNPFTIIFDNQTTGNFTLYLNGVVTLPIPPDLSFWYYDGDPITPIFEQIFGVNQYVPVTRTVAGKFLSNDVTLVKSDVGLSNVDNTSDATKNAAAVTLTNKTISTANNTLTIASNLSMQNYRITNLADPISSLDAVNLETLNNTVSGFLNKITAVAATTAALPAYTYNNVSGGVGATITANVAGVLTVDTYSSVLNDVLIVKNETGGSAPYNGVYQVTTEGNATVAFVLTRVTQLDQSAEFAGTAVFVSNGSVNRSTTWTCTTSLPTVGVTDITFTQSGASTSYSNGFGLTLTGTIFSVDHTTIPYKSDNLGVFATTTSSILANVITDRTGTGLLVFNDSPTLITPQYSGEAVMTTEGDQEKISLDVTPIRAGTWGTMTSGNLYALLGDFAMTYWSHNVPLDSTTGNFLGRDTADPCALEVFTEQNQERFYFSNTAAAGVVPTTWLLQRSFDASTGNQFYAGDLSVSGTIITPKITNFTNATHNHSNSAAGGTLTTQYITDYTDKRFVTDAELTVVANTSGINTGDQTTISGNAGSATVLQTARTINGVSFNGSANILLSLPYVSAGGTADALTATFSPAYTSLTDGMQIIVGAVLTNITTTPTLNVNGLGALTITRRQGQAMAAGSIAGTSHRLHLVYNSSTTTWELLNPAKHVFTDDIQILTNKTIVPRESSITSSSTPTPVADTTDIFTVTALAASATFGAPTYTVAPTQGQVLIIRIKDNGTAQSLAWNAIYRVIGTTLPTTTVLGKTLYIACIYNSTDIYWDVVGVVQQA